MSAISANSFPRRQCGQSSQKSRKGLSVFVEFAAGRGLKPLPSHASGFVDLLKLLDFFALPVVDLLFFIPHPRCESCQVRPNTSRYPASLEK